MLVGVLYLVGALGIFVASLIASQRYLPNVDDQPAWLRLSVGRAVGGLMSFTMLLWAALLYWLFL